MSAQSERAIGAIGKLRRLIQCPGLGNPGQRQLAAFESALPAVPCVAHRSGQGDVEVGVLVLSANRQPVVIRRATQPQGQYRQALLADPEILRPGRGVHGPAAGKLGIQFDDFHCQVVPPRQIRCPQVQHAPGILGGTAGH